MTRKADAEAVIIRESAQTRVETAENNSQALILECVSESKYATAQEGVRRHNEKIELAATMSKLGTHGKFVVSSNDGPNNMLDFYGDAIDQIHKR